MEKETKKKNTTGTKKTTSAKKTTSTKKTTAGSKQTKPVKKDSNVKTSTKKDEKVVKATSKKTTGAKKTNIKPSTKAETNKKVEVDVEVKKEEKVKAPSSKNNKTKEAKKEVKPVAKNEEVTLGEDFKSFIKSDIGSLVGIILIIVIVMGAFFFVTDFIKNVNKPEEDLVTSQSVQYDEILLSNALKQPNNAYYVFIYDKGNEVLDIKDVDIQTYEIYLGLYESSDDSLRVYRADMTKKFNEPYVTDEKSNLLVSKVEELKVSSTTLIKVEDGKVVAAFETRESIVEHLTSLLGE